MQILKLSNVKFLMSFKSLLKFFDINRNKRIIAGDFNIFFISKLEERGGKPLPKRKSVIKLVDIKESLDICYVWTIRNPKCQNFTFIQNHSTRFIERQLNYIFISNFLLPVMSTDHSPVLISLSNNNFDDDNNGPGLWK